MALGFMSRRSLQAFVLTSVVSLMAVGCTTSGNSFNTTAAHQMVAGQTTMADAVQILGADPVNTYRQTDGSVIGIWSHKSSVLTDAIYLNQELWLVFGPDGNFQRIAKKHNLPLNQNTEQQQNQSAAVAAPSQPQSQPSPPPVVVIQSTTPPEPQATGLGQPTVSYPIK